ncbi:MAG: DUF4412 domain-containing protein [Gammaproteobacteria bacterium]|nr:DUF4412 domain-containing protein [Gammaproteobacteria bacterium]
MRALLSMLILGISSLALADSEMSFSDGSTGLISNGKVLFGDVNASVLFENGQDYFVVLEHDKKTFMRMDKGFAADMQSQVKAEMEKMLAGMPEAQRAMAEQQMKAMMPQMQEAPKTSVTRTGETDEVANFDCDILEIVSDDGSMDSVVCVASRDELGLSLGDYQTLIGAMEAMQEMAAMAGSASVESDFDLLGGVPIRSKNKFHSSELVSIDNSDVDEARLQIPAGYTEVSIDDMMR